MKVSREEVRVSKTIDNDEFDGWRVISGGSVNRPVIEED